MPTSPADQLTPALASGASWQSGIRRCHSSGTTRASLSGPALHRDSHADVRRTRDAASCGGRWSCLGALPGFRFAAATATWEPPRMVWLASARCGRPVRRHGSSRTRSFGWLPLAALPCEATRYSARCLAAPSAGHTPTRPAVQRRLACRRMTASPSSPSLPPCPLSALRYAIAPGVPRGPPPRGISLIEGDLGWLTTVFEQYAFGRLQPISMGLAWNMADPTTGTNPLYRGFTQVTPFSLGHLGGTPCGSPTAHPGDTLTEGTDPREALRTHVRRMRALSATAGGLDARSRRDSSAGRQGAGAGRAGGVAVSEFRAQNPDTRGQYVWRHTLPGSPAASRVAAFW